MKRKRIPNPIYEEWKQRQKEKPPEPADWRLGVSVGISLLAVLISIIAICLRLKLR